MNICLLTWWGDSLTYTMARALAHNGHQVDILITDRERHLGNKWGNSARIRAIPGVRFLLDPSELSAPQHDLLLVQSYLRIAEHADVVRQLASRAAALTLVSHGDLIRDWRKAIELQLVELRVLRPHLKKLRNVAYKDGFHRWDLFGLLSRRTNIGFDVHSRFLHDPALFEKIHGLDWTPSAKRPIAINFVGSCDPSRRGGALDRVKAYLDRSGTDGRHEGRVMWRVYSDAEPGALPESDFVDILSNSDFTLAPPGHSLITHRPVESMLRGSIPILNACEAGIYELGLRDGENCLLVQQDDWAAAVDRALAIPQDRVADMRARIRDLNATRLQYGPLSSGICTRLGARH